MRVVFALGIGGSIVQFSLRTLVCRLSAVVVALALLLLLSPTLADANSISQLRSAFGKTFSSLRSARRPATCSLATAQGRISLIEMTRGQDHYLPSTTCEEAFSEAQKENLIEGSPKCGTATELKTFIKSAIVRVKGKHATIQLAEDIYCYTIEKAVRGATAVQLDSMGISHWIKRRGHWFFNDEPTGTYSPAGRKSAALLRSALSGSVIVIPQSVPSLPGSAASFCANGSSHFNWFGNYLPEGGPWYVAGGYSLTTNKPEAPTDAQGNPQGAVFVYQPVVAEWDVKLVGGTIVASSPMSPEQPVFQAGAAGC